MELYVILILVAFAVIVFLITFFSTRRIVKNYCEENNLDFKRFWRDTLLFRNKTIENENYKRLYEKDNKL